MDITKGTAMEMRERIINKEISARELVKAHMDRIEEMEGKINAFITVTKEEAFKKADLIDAKIKNGEDLGALAGIPIGIKDNIITEGIRTSCGSKMLENFIPPYEATVVDKINKEDGIILGKTNMDEFAMGSSTETSYFGTTKNPLDLERVPGGSSGGSAAAVKSNEVALSLGSDTGGSVRQPASFCGVVGIKPSYGLVSRYGLVSLANSFDQIGVMGRNVKDAALMLQVIVGHDAKDSTSTDMERINYLDDLNEDIRDMKIAVPKEFFEIDMDNRVRENVEKAIKVFEELGGKVEEISLPNSKYGLPTYYILSTAEISSNMSRFDGIRYGYRAKEYNSLDELYMNSRSEAFGKEVKRRIMVGTYALSRDHTEDYYKKALKVRTLIKNELDEAFKKYDIILSPTFPHLPFKIGERINDPVNMYKADCFTILANLAGICALSIPCGYIEGLPVGLQIMGDRYKEIDILKAAYAFELATGGVNNAL